MSTTIIKIIVSGFPTESEALEELQGAVNRLLGGDRSVYETTGGDDGTLVAATLETRHETETARS